MSSVSTAFKVHYNQKLGGHSAILGGGERTMAFGGIDAPESHKVQGRKRTYAKDSH